MSDMEKKEILEQEKDLGADELDEVAGGGECVCALGGGGTGDPDYEKTCACVFGGGGEYKSDYAAVMGKSKARCACFGAGSGVDY